MKYPLHHRSFRVMMSLCTCMEMGSLDIIKYRYLYYAEGVNAIYTYIYLTIYIFSYGI